MNISFRIAALLASFLFGEAFAQAPTHPQLWVWASMSLSSQGGVQAAESLINQAAADGYTGIAFADPSFSFMSDSFWPQQNVQYMRQVMTYAAQKGLQVTAMAAPYGHSNDALEVNPNWGEAQRVFGTRYKVDPGGTYLHLINSFPGLTNSNLEAGQVDWFDLGDTGVSLDSTVGHNDSSSAVISSPPGNARLRQLMTLVPWRQYHLQFFYKTSNFSGYPSIYLFDAGNFSITRLNTGFSVSGNHDWTEVDYTFDSQASTSTYLYLGIWGGASGKIWFDDIQISETGLVYVARRGGTPLSLYDPGSGAAFREGADFNSISDPQMTASKWPFYNAYHQPPTVTLPAGTSLKPGKIVAINSYSIFPEPGSYDVGLCLTEPAIATWLTQNAQSIASVLPAGGGYFMQYDEMWQMNSCAACKAKNMTAGQLLAWQVGQAVQVYRTLSPGAPLYVWSDMFDPYHNATPHYGYVEGDLTGSWEGLPADVTIMNWNLSNLTNSLTWFSGKNAAQSVPYRQIVAGYYDSGNGTSSAQTELSQAAGIPGIQGLMYTTWNPDYSQMQNFANAALAAWPAYLASVTQSAQTNPFPAVYSLISKNSGKCLDVDGQSMAAGVGMQQWDCWGGPNQKWTFNPIGKNGYEIISANSGLALGIKGGPAATQNGAPLQQGGWNNETNQQFQMQKQSDDSYQIVPVNSGLCLDVSGQSKADGAAIQQYSCWGGANQRWVMSPAP